MHRYVLQHCAMLSVYGCQVKVHEIDDKQNQLKLIFLVVDRMQTYCQNDSRIQTSCSSTVNNFLNRFKRFCN